MPSRILLQRVGPYALIRTLAWLRACAIGGQCVAVLACALWLRLPIPLLPLLCGIGVLGRPWAASETEAIAHVAVDTAVLGVLLYFTGGADNPFVTLLLVPIALTAAALSARAILAVATLAGAAYVGLLLWHRPLPLEPSAEALWLPLQEAGTAVNFVITALLLGLFINRLARGLRLQQLEMQRVRERALRDEGILAIATQAAGAAHELNTPLSTMLTLLPELRREHTADAALRDDLSLLQSQVERCRSILRELVAVGKAQLSQHAEHLRVADFVHDCQERFQLLRPEAELTLQLDSATGGFVLKASPGLRHALLNLLNNALDASAQRDSSRVLLSVARNGEWLEFAVRDDGPGFGGGHAPALTLGGSQKANGLGIGLALAQATAQRLGGDVHARDLADGAEVRLRLPLERLAAR